MLRINGWFILAIVVLCISTCDSCSGCRNNARDLYCPAPEKAAGYWPQPDGAPAYSETDFK